MLCTKDTVKEAGLNIWASGNRNNRGPEVEYEKQCYKVRSMLLMNLPALLQYKVLVLIRTTRGSRRQTWLSRINPDTSPYPTFFGNTVSQLKNRVTLLKKRATGLKSSGFKIYYQISFQMLGLRLIVTSPTGEKMLKQTCASVESSSSTFYTKTGSAMRLVELH